MKQVLVRKAEAVNGSESGPRPDSASAVVGEPCIPDALPCPTGSSPLHTIAGHYRFMNARDALVQRNGLPPDTAIPCLTYIRKPVERLVSFFYWMLHERPEQVIAALVLTRDRLQLVGGGMQPETLPSHHLSTSTQPDQRSLCNHGVYWCSLTPGAPLRG